MIYLNRIHSDSVSTRGVIVAGRYPLCHTLELPWRNNTLNSSSIPDGVYRLTKASSPRFDKCFYIHDVPNREGILIHVGNTLSDTKGCVLVGLDVNCEHVIESRSALQRLFSVLGDEEILCVRSVK